LFNQVSGLDSGFGHDDDYNLYDKPLFADRTAASIYKNVREVNEEEDEVPAAGDNENKGG
jgi:SNW domain-containing protein 1